MLLSSTALMFPRRIKISYLDAHKLFINSSLDHGSNSRWELRVSSAQTSMCFLATLLYCQIIPGASRCRHPDTFISYMIYLTENNYKLHYILTSDAYKTALEYLAPDSSCSKCIVNNYWHQARMVVEALLAIDCDTNESIEATSMFIWQH